MVIPLDQQPFGLHSKKRLLQNYEWFGSQPHYPGPVKFALALCIAYDKVYKNHLKLLISIDFKRYLHKSYINFNN